MNRELEKALVTISNISCYMGGEYIGESFEVYRDELNIIETTLKRLGDIERELGIDLITLFKALRQDNIWVKEHNTEEQEIVYERIRLNFLNRTLDFVYPRKEIGKGRNLFDYGESWALTKEELL